MLDLIDLSQAGILCGLLSSDEIINDILCIE
jgi:hypothetical protein